MGFGGNLVQGFRVYAWRAVPCLLQIALWVPSFALWPQPLWNLFKGTNQIQIQWLNKKLKHWLASSAPPTFVDVILISCCKKFAMFFLSFFAIVWLWSSFHAARNLPWFALAVVIFRTTIRQRLTGNNKIHLFSEKNGQYWRPLLMQNGPNQILSFLF